MELIKKNLAVVEDNRVAKMSRAIELNTTLALNMAEGRTQNKHESLQIKKKFLPIKSI